MDADPGPSGQLEPSPRPEKRSPGTPVRKIRFADVPGEATPRSVLATPASCTSACSNLSSLADTPLSAKMAKMADRCGVLLDEYFAEQPLEPLSPTARSDAGNDSEDWSADSTLGADHQSAETFHRYPELPTEIQDRILEEALAVHPSRGLDTRLDGSQPPALAMAAVSKMTRDQLFRIMERREGHCVSLLDRKATKRSEVDQDPLAK